MAEGIVSVFAAGFAMPKFSFIVMGAHSGMLTTFVCNVASFVHYIHRCRCSVCLDVAIDRMPRNFEETCSQPSRESADMYCVSHAGCCYSFLVQSKLSPKPVSCFKQCN